MNTSPILRFAPVALVVLFQTPLGAQQVPLPKGWPDAATVLERFKAGDDRHTSRGAIGMCPRESPYGDQLWSALLAEEPTPKLTMRLALAWAMSLRECNDPRIGAWYRDRLLQYRHDTFLVFALAHPLIGHRTPEDLEAVKRYAFDESVDEETRSAVLFALDHNRSWDEQMALYLEACQRTRAMPEPYAVDTFWNLMKSPAADRFVRRALDVIEQYPEGPNSARLLSRLTTHPELRKNQAWRSQLESVLVRITANPLGRFPDGLLTTARAGLETLRRTPPQ
jgi:hypothetical protein